MFPNSPYAHPVSSFQRPVPLVGTDPDQDPLVCVSFNASYLPYIIGALKQLILQSTWDTSDSNALNLQQQRISDLFYLFMAAQPCSSPCVNSGIGGDFMPLIRQNPTNSCILEGSFDNITWVTIMDVSKCMNFGNQPGSGTKQPSPNGGTSKNCYTLDANGILNLGTPVNTGDVIQLDASGSGWDGGEFDFGPLWRCPDGKQYIGGACENLTTTMSGDPVNTANHMSTIISINGTFYSILPGVPFTVPSGVTNITPFVQMNDSDITNNQGDYQVCVTITNNQLASWSHTLDFTASPNGFMPILAPKSAAYVGGTGFVEVYDTILTDTGCFCQIGKSFGSSCHITGVELTYLTEPPYLATLGASGIGIGNDISTNSAAVKAFVLPTDGGSTLVFSGDVVCSALTFLIELDMSTNPTTKARISKAVISGKGFDPFA